MIRSTHLLLTVRDAAGGVQTAGLVVADFPADIKLQVEVEDDVGGFTSTWVAIPIQIQDAMGIPPIKRLFLPPTDEEMLEAATKLSALERTLEESE